MTSTGEDCKGRKRQASRSIDRVKRQTLVSRQRKQDFIDRLVRVSTLLSYGHHHPLWHSSSLWLVTSYRSPANKAELRSSSHLLWLHEYARHAGTTPSDEAFSARSEALIKQRRRTRSCPHHPIRLLILTLIPVLLFTTTTPALDHDSGSGCMCASRISNRLSISSGSGSPLIKGSEWPYKVSINE